MTFAKRISKMSIVNKKENKQDARCVTAHQQEKGNIMSKNKIFSAIMRGFEVSGINALSSAAGSSSVNGALQEIIDTRR